jgi:hypothetical protein
MSRKCRGANTLRVNTRIWMGPGVKLDRAERQVDPRSIDRTIMIRTPRKVNGGGLETPVREDDAPQRVVYDRGARHLPAMNSPIMTA